MLHQIQSLGVEVSSCKVLRDGTALHLRLQRDSLRSSQRVPVDSKFQFPPARTVISSLSGAF